MRIFALIAGGMGVSGCERGWQEDPRGNCLRLSTISRTWHDAQNECINSGAHLVHVEDEEYNSIVSQLAEGESLWLGYESPQHADTYFNSKGMSAEYTRWSPLRSGESAQGSSCALMDAETGLWNSASCLRELPYICQKQERIVGNKLTDSTFESLMTCHDWIHQALTCRKPAEKISKYEFRFTKVAKDALWHVLAVKNCNWNPGYENTDDGRYRREANGKYDSFSLNFDDMYLEYIVHTVSQNNTLARAKSADDEISDKAEVRLEERQNKQEKAHLLRAEKLCRSSMTSLWSRKEFNQCPKLGSWKRRIGGLQDTVSRMMNICLRRQTY